MRHCPPLSWYGKLCAGGGQAKLFPAGKEVKPKKGIPEVSMLLISSRKPSSATWPSVNKNAVGPAMSIA